MSGTVRGVFPNSASVRRSRRFTPSLVGNLWVTGTNTVPNLEAPLVGVDSSGLPPWGRRPRAGHQGGGDTGGHLVHAGETTETQGDPERPTETHRDPWEDPWRPRETHGDPGRPTETQGDPRRPTEHCAGGPSGMRLEAGAAGGQAPGQGTPRGKDEGLRAPAHPGSPGCFVFFLFFLFEILFT